MLTTVKLRDLKSDGDQRVRPQAHQRHQRHRRNRTDRQGDEGDRVAPLTLLAVDRPEGEAADGQRDDRGAQPVEARRSLLVATLLDVRQHRVESEGDERDVEQEHRAPGNGVHQHAADEGPEQGGSRGRAGPDAVGAGLAGPREGGGDQRERARHQESAGCPLEEPEDDQQLEVGGEPAEDGGQPEADEAEGEHPPPPVVVVDSAGQDE